MMERYPIENGTVIEINGVRIRVDELVGEGSTCLVYRGKVLDNELLIQETMVVIKEFYPQSSVGFFDITRSLDGKLSVSKDVRELPEYIERKKQFETGYKMQKHLANSEVMEVMVKPLLFGTYGDASYLVSDVHMGKSLDRMIFENLEDKLACAVRIAELFGILHEAGYMMLDFKPENFLWTERPKSLKLIDADSIFRYKRPQAVYGAENDIAADLGAEDVFYMNQKYGTPEILYLKAMLEKGMGDLEEKKSSYFVPNVNVYNTGKYMFELLFERMPLEEDKKFPESLTEELYGRYKSWFGSRKMAENLLNVLKQSLQRECRKRYQDGFLMMDALNASIEEITSRKYTPKKIAAKANQTYLSYNLLEKYPLYEYSHKDGDTTVLDVAIAGSGSFREVLLKAVISCGQMLNSVLNVRLIAKDAEDFWAYYQSDDCNPEVRRTMRWFVNGRLCDNSAAIKEAEIVESPLANIYLETDDSNGHIAEIVKENGTGYVVFAYGQEETDYEKAVSLIKTLSGKKHFVGYLLGEQGRQIEKKGKTDVYPISMEKVSKGYSEKIYKSKIYQMGMSIHEYYYRGGHPRAAKEEVRESYASDVYNIESSERSALHTNYKLQSIGIDPKSAKAPYLFYEKVLKNKSGKEQRLFDELAALEHRSWTAFLILSGVRAVDDVRGRLEKYAYAGKSDWKEKDASGKVVSHPCLKAGRPGKNLTPVIWERSRKGRLSRENLERLDPLDRTSLEIYDAVYRIAEGKKKEAERRLLDLEDYLRNAGEAVWTAYHILLSANGKIFAQDNRETNSPILWRQAMEEFTEICEYEEVLSENLKEKLAVIEELMKPVLWCADYHDFKEADEDILLALPRILIQNGKIEQKNTRITIVKPMTEEAWKNIYSTMIVRPDLLVLVPFHGEREEIAEQYGSWLKSCKVDTKVQMKTLDQLRAYGGKNGQIFIDETGVIAEYSRKVSENPYMKDAHLFRVEGRKLKATDGNALITLFNRPVNLTVREILMLHGAEMVSEKTEDGILGLSTLQYISLWNLYRDLRDGRKWKIFIQELQRLEEAKHIRTELGEKGAPVRYEAGYAERSMIKNAGIENILEELSVRKLLDVYKIPKKDEYGLISFSTTYQKIAEALMQTIAKAAEEPLRHKYSLEITEKAVVFTDDSLYVTGTIPHEPDPDLKGVDFCRDDVMNEIHDMLEQKSKDKALQNFRFGYGKDQAVSFRYASKAVKEALKKEGSLLEAVVFHECRKRGLFDDIRANVEILWPGGRTKNEIDIIGTKNSKAYFISVKMCMPEQEHIYEIESLCRRFSVEGHAILVSSYFMTGKDEKSGGNYKARPVAVENRIEDMRNMSGDMSYIGRDGVDCMKSYVRKNQTEEKREIVIASSIADIVEKENLI